MPTTYAIEEMPYGNFVVWLYSTHGGYHSTPQFTGALWAYDIRRGVGRSYMGNSVNEKESLDTLYAIITDELKERGLIPH